VELLSILGFVALIGGVVLVMFLPKKQTDTFTRDEMDAFRHAEQVKKDLADVQKMVGPAKAPYTLTIGGANLPAPEKKPDSPAS
jgi:hypothetical protein